MGDGSSRRDVNLTKQKTQPAGTTPIESQGNWTETPDTFGPHMRIIYSHKKIARQHLDEIQAHEHCSSFDELLAFLETDFLKSIWFDSSVTQQERTYITGWAKIFRPEITVQDLPTEKNLH